MTNLNLEGSQGTVKMSNISPHFPRRCPIIIWALSLNQHLCVEQPPAHQHPLELDTLGCIILCSLTFSGSAYYKHIKVVHIQIYTSLTLTIYYENQHTYQQSTYHVYASQQCLCFSAHITQNKHLKLADHPNKLKKLYQQKDS